MDSKRSGRRKPRLDRRNAAKDIDYNASSFFSSFDDSPSSPSSSSSPLITRSLDLDKTSFRIQGTDGEFELICQSLGLNGPEDFSIPTAAWEARKIRSSSDLLPRSRLNRLHTPEEDGVTEVAVAVAQLADMVSATELTELKSNASYDSCYSGIKGFRPPSLKLPPGMKLSVIDNGCST